MLVIDKQILPALCAGATLLGSGGGGNTEVLFNLIDYLMKSNNSVRCININDLKHQDKVIPVAFVGAPLITSERLPNFLVFQKLYDAIKQDYPDHNLVIMPAEIGGCNALTPFVLALLYDLPVLNADLIGRAFPTLDMCKPAALNYSCAPSYLSDHHGNLIQLKLNKLELLEHCVRDLTVRFGSSALIATFLHEGKNSKNYVIEGSITYAINLGERLLNREPLPIIGSGVIHDVFQTMRAGFLVGNVIIKNTKDRYKIDFQNEFLRLKKNDNVLAGSPDLIAIIDKKTGLALSTESLSYGLSVDIAVIDSPEFWKHKPYHTRVDYQQLPLEVIWILIKRLE